MEEDPFLRQYQPSDLKVASEFLRNWLPFLSRDLCKDCVHVLSDRIQSLDPEHCSNTEKVDGECKGDSCSMVRNVEIEENALRSLSEASSSVLPSRVVETASPRMSWADMSQEDDELEGDEDEEEERGSSRKGFNAMKSSKKPKLTKEQRENLRLMNVKRKKDFICLERVKGKIVNVLDGLELHTGVFSAVEQKRIVDYVYQLQEKGRKGELKECTFTAPHKWMRGKGRVTIQFGCCYNYVTDRDGNPPGILKREEVDPLPSLFKVIIRKLIKWHVLPPTCVPDSCIVNIYDEGDCIPPHIDNHEFLRPFCTISLLSECDILFGSNLRVEGPGEFAGSFSIPLPVGSVLVLNGNAADVAKHCVPAVPTKRISITFRKMDESKRPVWFTPESDLQGIEPLPLELNRSGSAARSSGSNNHYASHQRGRGRRGGGRGNNQDTRGYYNPERSNHDLRGYDNPERSNHDLRGYDNPERSNHDLRGYYNPERSNHDSRGHYNPERSSEQYDSREWSSSQRRGRPRS
ncbi:hypothetical protein AALP_AA3G339700 [Arabis alpina]|uniref:Fe2OG dioxygenase domain-containing protein n=1 Tax=Arabis alpina TaxID=50452 RepID=A0A087HDG9_ARAAL|nr:hypothetical protein AALP_AA3G339700 [Arabis alpina]